MRTHKHVLILSGIFILSLIGCSQVSTGDGFVRASRTQVSADAFTIVEKADLKVDKVQSNNLYRIQANLKQVGSHVSLLAHTDESLAGGARIQVVLIANEKLRVLYGLQGQAMKMVEKPLKEAATQFTFEVSLYNEADEIGVEVEESTQGLELLHAHIEEGNGTGRSVGVEYSNDGTQVGALDIKFNIPEHAHGGAEDAGAAAPPSAKARRPKRLQLEVDRDGAVSERVDLKLDGPRGDTRYHLLVTLPNLDDQVTLLTNAKENKEGGVTISFRRSARNELSVSYGMGENQKTAKRVIGPEGKLNLAISVYSEADEVGLDVFEKFSQKNLLHAHIHQMAQGREIFLVRTKDAQVQDLAIETEIAPHAH
ncbi:MAG: hypothetical protein H6617_11070 [Bdellovibrionaceae bacterium]|nr:hypothetical protein [Bdellovibrionales bacterium]MCB9255213.1 hypothetical protein [Pseudobdellovibrionaceae bacterium]